MRKDFWKYATSCSGVDGGDIVGMEWSDFGNGGMEKYYKNGQWQIIREPEFENIDIYDKKQDDWVFEQKLQKLYKELPNKVSNATVFSANSNSFKLNLFPLPFTSDKDLRKKSLWAEDEGYGMLTGCSSFEEYKKEIVDARQICFDNLLKKGKHPKTIFCFGLEYEEFFARAFHMKIADFKCVSHIGRNSRILAAFPDDDIIKQILICPFPYYPYSPEDVEKIKRVLV